MNLRPLVNLRVAFAGMAAAALLSGVSALGAYRAQQDTRTETRVREAEGCVTAWEVRDRIRAAVDAGARAGAKFGAEAGAAALIGVATKPDPAVVAHFRHLIDQGLADDVAFDRAVAGARAKIPDPVCDLAAAKRRLR